jgi:hypothetical protein
MKILPSGNLSGISAKIKNYSGDRELYPYFLFLLSEWVNDNS